MRKLTGGVSSFAVRGYAASEDAVSAIKFALGASSRLLAIVLGRQCLSVRDQGKGDNAEATLVRKFPHHGPVLDACFGKDESEAFSAGLDHTVQR